MVFKNKLDPFLVGFLYRNIMFHPGGRTAWSERSSPAEQSKVLQETEIITDQWVFFIIVQLEYSDLPQILFKIISASLIWLSKNFCSPSTWAHCFHPDSWHKLRGLKLWCMYSPSHKEPIQKLKKAWHEKPHHASCCPLPSLPLMVTVCKKRLQRSYTLSLAYGWLQLLTSLTL